MYRTLASKASLSLEFRAESWSLVQVSVRPVRELAETSAEFVDQVGKSPETFVKSNDIESSSRTYLPG